MCSSKALLEKMVLFGDLDQNYFTLLSLCRYESSLPSHLEQIFRFLSRRDAQSFFNNKLALVNSFPGHSLNSSIQNVSQFYGGFCQKICAYIAFMCGVSACACTQTSVHLHLPGSGDTRSENAVSLCAYYHKDNILRNLSGTVVSRVHKIHKHLHDLK